MLKFLKIYMLEVEFLYWYNWYYKLYYGESKVI